jgi:DNA recombination protein RmuC
MVIALFLYIILSKQRQTSDTGFKLILEQINQLSRSVDFKISENNRSMQNSVVNQLTESQKLMRMISDQMTKELLNVAKGMTESSEVSKQVLGVTESLKNLEKVLKHQKQRGALGEASLELILSNILPPGTYKMQHQFETGEKVDAIIQTKDGIIPIDAKFSLDNYNRLSSSQNDSEKIVLEKEFSNDLKKRIDETAKYIKPEEGTLPFAFMFIPAEGIYYDLLVNEVAGKTSGARSLLDYAYNDKKVIIVSPTTFSAYLQSVLYGFKAFKIEESAKDIIKKVDVLGKHLASFDKSMRSLGSSLGTVVNHYNTANKELLKIDKDVLKITGSSSQIQENKVEKPEDMIDLV